MLNSETIIEAGHVQRDIKPDPSNGVLPSVRLHGEVSTNGYRYSEKAMKKLVGFYDGLAIVRNHDSKGYEHLIGCVRRPVLGRDPSGNWEIRGDAELNRKDSLYDKLVDDAERRPHLIKFSHEIPTGKAVFEETRRGRVIDDVTEVRQMCLIIGAGGVNKGLYEGKQDMEVEIREAADVKKHYPAVYEQLNKESLKECSCQQTGGALEKVVNLQSELDSRASKIKELELKVAELTDSITVRERKDALIQEAATLNRKLTNELADALLALPETADRQTKITAIIKSQEEIRESVADADKKPASETPKQGSGFVDADLKAQISSYKRQPFLHKSSR